MFNGRALQVKMVKTARNAATPEPAVQATPEVIDQIIKDQAKNLAKLVVIVTATVVVLDTASKIALKLTPTR